MYELNVHALRTRMSGDFVLPGDADWIAARLAHACPPLGTEVERVAEQRFRVYESGAHG